MGNGLQQFEEAGEGVGFVVSRQEKLQAISLTNSALAGSQQKNATEMARRRQEFLEAQWSLSDVGSIAGATPLTNGFYPN